MLWYEKTTVSSYSLLICQYVTLPLFRYSAFHFITLVFSSLVKQILQRIVIRWEASFPLFLSLVLYHPLSLLLCHPPHILPELFFLQFKIKFSVFIVSFGLPPSFSLARFAYIHYTTTQSRSRHRGFNTKPLSVRERLREKERERDRENYFSYCFVFISCSPFPIPLIYFCWRSSFQLVFSSVQFIWFNWFIGW